MGTRETTRRLCAREIGSTAWTNQRENLERLNLQAHQNAVTHSDEFVKEFLISHDKVSVVVHELLLIEVWKEKVLPNFGAKALDQSITNMNAYLASYFEATLCNLLEIAFFHQDTCEAAGDDALLETVLRRQEPDAIAATCAKLPPSLAYPGPGRKHVVAHPGDRKSVV